MLSIQIKRRYGAPTNCDVHSFELNNEINFNFMFFFLNGLMSFNEAQYISASDTDLQEMSWKVAGCAVFLTFYKILYNFKVLRR